MSYEEAFKNCLASLEEYKKRPAEKRDITNVRNPAYWLGLGGNQTSAGVSVTPNTAMRTSAVWACIRVLSTSLAASPLHVYQDVPGEGKRLATERSLYQMLHRAPNPEQTSFIFRQTAMAHICLYGNAYAEIEFNQWGYPVNLWPIPSWCCYPDRTIDGELFYNVTYPPNHRYARRTIATLQPYRMLHVMGLSTDGMQGLSPIRQHAQSIGITLAAEQFGASFFGSGMNVGGVAEHPRTLTAQGSDNLRKSLNEKYAGLGNSHRLLLLEEGMKYQRVGIPPNEAQFLETRNFQIEDVARIYGVQLHKIGHLLHATFSNIEQQNIEFVTDTMLPWVVNWEQEYDRKLCPAGFYTKHSLEGLLRGDSASRAAFYRELFYLGAISADEIREKEDWNPEPNNIGERYYVQANMIPADKIDVVIDKNTGQGNTALANKIDGARGMLRDAVRRVAEREKQNITRHLKQNPEGLIAWLPEYYRDFKEFIVRQVEPALGERASEYANRYIEQSKRDIEGAPAANIETLMASWETTRPEPSITGLV